MEESVRDVAYRPGPGLLEKDRPVTKPRRGKDKEQPSCQHHLRDGICHARAGYRSTLLVPFDGTDETTLGI